MFSFNDIKLCLLLNDIVYFFQPYNFHSFDLTTTDYNYDYTYDYNYDYTYDYNKWYLTFRWV